MTVREKLINAGIRNLREYGYPHVTAENILTDYIYSQFLSGMLRVNLGKGSDKIINELLFEITAHLTRERADTGMA